MKIKVTTDSTCDLPADFLRENDITLVPLHVVKDGADFLDGVTITPADIFAHVAAGGELCSTAAVNVAEYLEIFTPLAAQYDAVVHVSLSSQISSSYTSACLAAEEFPNVRVIDSRSLCCGQGLVAAEACRLGGTCVDLDELCVQLEELVPQVECSFLIADLKYLVKGGRCSSVAALGANLLGLKPCIQLFDGKLQVVKKYRGSFERCIASYLRDRLEGRDDLRRDLICAPRTVISESEAETIRTTLEACGPFGRVLTPHAGCTISCHCGPGTVGLMLLRTGPVGGAK
jgi:DegV family protein with EDD domain